MPTWRHSLPASNAHMGFEIIRTPQTGNFGGIVTSDDLLVCDTHYWHGRTVPCERPQLDEQGNKTGSDCPACAAAISYRTHVYLSAFNPLKNHHFLFECTAHAAKAFDDYRATAGTLRGCSFHACRPKGAPNSKVVIDCQTANLGRLTLPTAPSLILALSVIWRLPLTGLAIEHDNGRLDPNIPGPHRERPTVHTREEPIKEMRDVPSNATNPPTVGDILSGNGHHKPGKVPA